MGAREGRLFALLLFVIAVNADWVVVENTERFSIPISPSWSLSPSLSNCGELPLLPVGNGSTLAWGPYKHDAPIHGWRVIFNLIALDFLDANSTFTANLKFEMNGKVPFTSFVDLYTVLNQSMCDSGRYPKINATYTYEGLVEDPLSSIKFEIFDIPIVKSEAWFLVSWKVEVLFTICGDGIRAGNETCDDSNTDDGDGCSSSCEIEDNWICSYPGSLCCQGFDGNEGLSQLVDQDLQCLNGMWSLMGNENRSTNITLQGPIHIVNNFQFCGDYVITSGSLVIDNSEIHIFGSLSVGNATLQFNNRSSLWIHEYCLSAFTEENEVHLSFGTNSTLALTDFGWEDKENVPPLYIHTTHCVSLGGTFLMNATEIPSGSNDFYLLHSNKSCINSQRDPFKEQHYDLPDGCSNLEITSDKTNTIVTLNRKTLCPAQIVGIVLGCFAIVVIIVVAVVVVLGGGGSSAGGDAYVAL